MKDPRLIVDEGLRMKAAFETLEPIFEQLQDELIEMLMEGNPEMREEIFFKLDGLKTVKDLVSKKAQRGKFEQLKLVRQDKEKDGHGQ